LLDHIPDSDTPGNMPDKNWRAKSRHADQDYNRRLPRNPAALVIARQDQPKPNIKSTKSLDSEQRALLQML
jgi:hypothetical protein